MAGYVETPTRTFPDNAALAEGLRVTLSGGYLAAAGSTDVGIGTMEERTLSTDTHGVVRLRTAQGTKRMIASEAIPAGDPCYSAASGKVAASGTVLEGTVLTAAGADGDVIEVLPISQASSSGSSGGTTAAAFVVDNDVGKPKMALGSQTGGTGDYKTTLRPPATLTADRVATFQNDADANIKTDYTFAATPNSSAGAGNSIPVGCRQVAVGAPANNADDFIVLPAIASVSIGDQIVIACNGGSNFELRTPASSNTKINDVDCDGSQEYLCTDTDVVIVTKATTTGWVAQSLTKLGAVRTAVVPD